MQKKALQKKLSVMERTVPKSKKYEHVQGKLDTGLNVNKVRTVTAREYTRRRDEIFFRITKTNLYELYNEYEADEHEMISEAIIGTENGPRIVTHSDDSRALYNKPYLILDVRDTESFNTYHLLQARSYPDTMMRRDFVHPEFFAFKNKPQTLIIVYCDDERISQESAKVLVDRGADNIYLLSGGIQEFAAHFPSFIEGNIPECVQSRKTSGLARIPEDSRSGSGASKSGHTPSVRSGRSSLRSDLSKLPPPAHMSRNRDDCRSDSGMTSASNASVAESIISKASARKGKF